MDGMLALTIVCVVFAIGDFISDKTHAIIPVLLFRLGHVPDPVLDGRCSDDSVHRCRPYRHFQYDDRHLHRQYGNAS